MAGLAGGLVVLAIIVILFIIFRALVLWYWRVNHHYKSPKKNGGIELMAGRKIVLQAVIVTAVFLCSLNVWAAPFAYVANLGSVSVIDTSSNSVVAAISVPNSGSTYTQIAVNPTGTRVYATTGTGVSVIDTGTNSVITTIPVGGATYGLAVNPAGSLVYVGVGNNVSVIAASTNSIVDTISVGMGSFGIAMNPTGSRVYVTSDFNISVIDTSTDKVVSSFAGGGYDSQIVINPSGTVTYVTNPLGSSISVMDTSTNKVISNITTDDKGNSLLGTSGVVINPAGTRVYVSETGSNKILAIDTSTNAVVASMLVGFLPEGVAINPAGTYIYVANDNSSSVSVIDTSTNKVVATVPVGSYPYGIAIGGPTLISYTIAASAGTGGSISPSGTTTVSSGGGQSYTIMPSTGYSIADVKVDGASVGAVTTYAFNNMAENHTISATFAAATPTLTLNVTKSGMGTGTVKSADGVINCGSTCSYQYSRSGLIVTLTASPDAGVTFGGWSGGTCTGTGTCIFTINNNTTINGDFRFGSFDDELNNVFAPYIEAIKTAAITTGCGNGDYCPSDNVTRDQMAAFLVRSTQTKAGLSTVNFTCNGGANCATETPYFNDVPTTDGFFPYVQKLYELAITTGCGNGQYCPSQFVTRDQMAAFIIRALYGGSSYIPICNGGVTGASVACASTTPYFSDVPATDSFFPYVQKMKELGITTGCGNGQYCPSQNVARDQMAAFLSRAFLGMK